MKFTHALLLAGSLAFLACGDDSSSGPSSTGYDCSVTNGVKIVSPAMGETFTVGQTIDVVFGTSIDEDYRIAFMKSASDMPSELLDASYELPTPADGKTCYTVKVTLDAAHGVEATSVGFIRVIPYDTQYKFDSTPIIVK
jgi:hypothetical protein